MTVPDLDYLSTLVPHVRTVPVGTVLWRIHSTCGDHVIPWNALRTFGPVVSARWDPHPEPPGDYTPLGAAYLGYKQLTCVAEVFQTGRFVDADAHSPYITGFALDQELCLIDISTEWFVKAGGTSAVAAGPKDVTRQWARALHQVWPDMDGLVAGSDLAPGHEVLTVWKPKLPSSTLFTSALNNPAIAADISAMADLLGFGCNVA